ncbi:DUF5691 domain-containing protein [Streptomyces indonesiensis]
MTSTTPVASSTSTASSTSAASTAPSTSVASTASTASTASWDDLVAAALLGTERRTPPVAPRPGQNAPSALLDAAALSTVRRRAGLRPAPARPGPGRAPEDPRPALPTAARSRLALLLADRSAPGRGGSRSAPDLAELLPQWLALANHRGYRVPDALLPALLDAARARTDLRAEALTLGGPRALWLARLNPDWRFALRGAAGRASAAHPEPSEATAAPDEEQRLWEEGLFAERVSLLAAARHRDPAAGLALLSGTWSTERAEDRLMFLDSLRDDLSPSDEPFLEQALSDRSRNVRATAAELLSALPGSALAARMAERSRSCVSLTADEPTADEPTADAPPVEGSTAEGSAHDGLTADEPTAAGRTPRITVRPPDECDSGMQRDGIVPKPPSGRGNGPGGWVSWWRRPRWTAGPSGSADAVPPKSWRCPSRTAGRRISTRPGAGPPCGSAAPSGAVRCSAPRRSRRSPPGRRPPPPGATRRSCSPRCPPGNGRSGWPSSSRPMACPTPSGCSGCARCPGPSRWAGPSSTPWTSPGTRAATPGASAASWAWPSAAWTRPRRTASKC